jgi:hypothetical protein
LFRSELQNFGRMGCLGPGGRLGSRSLCHAPRFSRSNELVQVLRGGRPNSLESSVQFPHSSGRQVELLFVACRLERKVLEPPQIPRILES